MNNRTFERSDEQGFGLLQNLATSMFHVTKKIVSDSSQPNIYKPLETFSN